MIVLAVLILCLCSIVIHSLKVGISPMPSSQYAKDAILRLLPEMEDGAVIYELGSGWGGLALEIAKRFPHAKVIAFETSPIPYFISKILTVENLTFIRKNFYGHDLSDATAVICYLFPGAMKKLSSKLQDELPDGSIVVSNTFSLPGWEGSVRFLDDWSATRIYKYQKKRTAQRAHTK